MIGNVYVCVHATRRCARTYTHRAKSGDWQIHASLFRRADILPFNQRAQSMCFCSQSLVRDKVNILSDGLQRVISPCNGPVTAPPLKTLNFSDWIHGSALSLLWTFDNSSASYTRGTFFSPPSRICGCAEKRRKPGEGKPVYKHPCILQ